MGFVDLDQPVRERMRDRLEGADRLTELLALASIGRGELDRFAAKAAEIVESALGYDDFTGKVRRSVDLDPADGTGVESQEN